MNERLEKIFISFADDHEDTLTELSMTKEEFIDNARKWSESREGSLEIQKFMLQQEVNDLEEQVNELQVSISKKMASIEDIDTELENL